MPYVLGVHLGATGTAAATARRDGEQWTAATAFPLGSHGPVVPTALCKQADGTFAAGDAALRYGPANQGQVARSFTRMVGDDIPLLVGDEFVAAHQLAARMIEWVADVVAFRMGRPPEHIVVAHSSSWGPYRAQVVNQALAQLRLSEVTFLPEPVAVAVDYANNQPVEDGGIVLVGNMGGSGFDATVLRRKDPGFVMIGSPLDSDHPSGTDLDDEVFSYVRAELASQLPQLDPYEPRTRDALAQIRGICGWAKETLSYQPEVAIPVALPQLRTEIRLSRSRFEQAAQHHLERVPELLLQVLHSSSLAVEEVDAVVLAGGASRIPLLRNLVSQKLEQPALVDSAPELVAARGAAVAAIAALPAETGRKQLGSETELVVRAQGSMLRDDEPEEERGARAERPSVEIEPMYVEEPPPPHPAKKIAKLTAAALFIVFGVLWFYWRFYLGGTPNSGGFWGMLGHL